MNGQRTSGCERTSSSPHFQSHRSPAASSFDSRSGSSFYDSSYSTHKPPSRFPLESMSRSSETSSNEIAFNQRGPGRVLDNFFIWASAPLERGLERLVHHAKYGGYAKAEKNMSTFDVDDLAYERVGKDACDLLLDYAGSRDPATQFMAFEAIVRRLVLLPSIRNLFRGISIRRYGVPIEVITHAWKRHQVDYSDAWLHLYDLVALGLSDRGEEIFGVPPERAWDRKVDFQSFEWTLSRCRGMQEVSLAVEFMAWAWNGQGLCAYIKRAGFSDAVLFNCAVALEMRYEVLLESEQLGYHLNGYFLPFAKHFLSEMWSSIRTLESDKLEIFLEDGSQMDVWIKIMNIYWKSKICTERGIIFKLQPGLADTWTKECFKQLQDPKYARLRARLSRLEEGTELNEPSSTLDSEVTRVAVLSVHSDSSSANSVTFGRRLRDNFVVHRGPTSKRNDHYAKAHAGKQVHSHSPLKKRKYLI
ncbi:hypothetical protein SCHPADRAFT_567375 [Schizopora paradoxa]|uniref:Uncharacterized protein n=1 Tax=Schizopora paradoxa TaxID=27342 RepID=A0A0H2RX45_9AGAM|nr:hypothetical protein SCHPADRAFT_567375 [Schizopora paradoxa]